MFCVSDKTQSPQLCVSFAKSMKTFKKQQHSDRKFSRRIHITEEYEYNKQNIDNKRICVYYVETKAMNVAVDNVWLCLLTWLYIHTYIYTYIHTYVYGGVNKNIPLHFHFKKQSIPIDTCTTSKRIQNNNNNNNNNIYIYAYIYICIHILMTFTNIFTIILFKKSNEIISASFYANNK